MRAQRELDRRQIGNVRINVQWSKRSGKFEPSERVERTRRDRSPQKPLQPARGYPDYTAIDAVSYDFSYDEEELREMEKTAGKDSRKRVKLS